VVNFARTDLETSGSLWSFARTPGRLAAIGSLDEIEQLLDGRAGTVVISEAAGPEYAAEEASTRP